MNYCKKNDTQRNTGFFLLFFSAVSILFVFSFFPSLYVYVGLYCVNLLDIENSFKTYMREGILFETLLSSLLYVKFVNLFIFQT